MHQRNVFGEFQGGEPRIVYARDRSRGGERFFLENGSVTDGLRRYARENLECIVPGCPDPRLIVVRRTDRRDGFKHHSGAGSHSPETVFHQQAKALLVRWVQARYPGLTVAEEVQLAGRERQADVLVAWPNKGPRVALEFQHSSVTPEKWTTRHDSYAGMGVADVWLLGNNATYLVKDRRCGTEGPPDRILLTPLLNAVLQAGQCLLWLNPEEETVGFAHSIRRAPAGAKQQSWQVPVEPYDDTVVFATCRLDDCQLTPHGIVVPAAGDLARNRNEWLTAKAAAEKRAAEEAARRCAAQEAVRAKRLEQEKAEKAQREAAAAKKAARQREAIRLREVRHQAWLASPLRARIIARYGVIPTPIAARAEPDNGVFAYPEEWHAILYKTLIHGRTGHTFTIADVYQALTATGIELHPDPRPRAKSVINYLTKLQSLGYLDIDLADNGWYVNHVTVLHDLDNRPSPSARPTPDPLPPPAKPVRSDPPDPRPEPDPLEPLPDFHAAMGRIEHYMPGLQPILRWHDPAIQALGTGTPATIEALRAALQTALGSRADTITEEAIAHAIDGFRGRLRPQNA